MSSIVTVIAAALLAVGLLGGGFVWSRRAGGDKHDGVTPEYLVEIGQGLGLETYTKRNFFGEQVQILAGEFRDLYAELEVSTGRWRPYVRLVLDFDEPLARDVSVFSDNRAGFISYVQRVREIEIGNEEFDHRFLLYAPGPDDVRKLLPPATRDQMIRLDEKVDNIRVTDSSLFLSHHGALDRDQVRSILKKSLDLGERLQRTAGELGARRPETAAARYEQATIEQAVRSEEPQLDTGRDRTTSRQED